MQELSGSNNTYTPKRLKQKLLDRYGDHIYFSEVEGKTNVLSFRDMVNYISWSWHANKMDNTDDETNRIILTAAKIIKAEMRNATYDLNNYPCENDIKSSDRGLCFLPPPLRLLLKAIIPNQVKVIRIRRCIVSAAKPRSSLPPVLFGLCD